MRTIEHSPGQVLMIYQDPISREHEEGKAELIKFMCKDEYPPYRETWEVHFIEDDPSETYTRSIIS